MEPSFWDSTLVAVLSGAVIGGIVTVFGFLLSKYFERRSKHYNALVDVEYAMHENLDKSYINIKSLEQFQEALGKKEVMFPTLTEFTLPKAALYAVQNRKFINDLFGICRDMEKANQDLAALSIRYDKIVDRFSFRSERNPNEAFNEYSVNANIMMENVTMIKEFLEKLDGRIEEITAESQVLYNYHPRLIDSLIKSMSHADQSPKDFDSDIKAAQKLITEEREQHKTGYKDKL